MIKYKDLKKIAQTRFKEAKVLYKNQLYDGCVYLCGYVVEVSLKARICKTLNIDLYPDDDKNLRGFFSSHDFDRLLLLSGLQNEINALKNPRLFTNWSLLTKWKPESRYTPIGTYKKQNAIDLINALSEKDSGFYKWIKKIW